MLRTLSICLALSIGAAAAAQTCDYRQPAPSAAMIEAEKMRKAESSPFALIMHLRATTEKEPRNALAWQWRGSAEAAGGDYGAAIESLDKAVSLDPCDPAARLTRAGLAAKLGQLKLAFDDYSAILSRDPANALAHRLRGDILFDVAEFSAALLDYDAAVATGSTDVDLLLNRGGLMQEFGRFRDAIADYDKILANESDNVEALVARGYSEFFLQDFAAAAPDLATGATINPNAAAWTFLARARLGQADALDRLVEDTKKLPRQNWIGLVAEYLKAGASDERLLRLAAEDPERRCNIYFYLGELALAKGERTRAKALFEKGADACPKDPTRTNGSLREYVAIAEELKRMR